MRISGRTDVVKEGDFISIDGSSGDVYLGKIATRRARLARARRPDARSAQAPIYQLYAQS